MTKKEKEIQKALGLIKTYCGYVSIHGSTHYNVYEVQDVSKKDAREQLNKIVKEAQKKAKGPLKLEFIVDETKNHGSNPKS